jgi:hypothetical protein
MSEHTAALPELQPERRNTRGLVAVTASVLAVVLIAGGGFAAWQFFFASGPRPAEVLPDSTFALASVDLDPSGGQKVEAIKTLRKFPSWRKRTGVTTDSDLMKPVFDQVLKSGPCKSLDYEADVKPWIGSRAAVGGVLLGDGKPAPVFALQIKDTEQAKTGFARLAKCTEADAERFGWTVSDDYVLASDSTSHAEAIAAAGKKAPLAESADFQKWTEEAGGTGIVNIYVGRKSVRVFSDLARDDFSGLTGDGPAASPDANAENELTKSLKDFTGAAAVLRFADGGIEFSFASGGATKEGDPTVGKHVGDLPEDTAAVLAVAVPDKAVEKLKSSDSSDTGMLSFTEMFTEGTGLDLPDDLVTLLGTSLSLSVGGDAPADLDKIGGLGDLPLGVLIHGDEAQIKAIIAKVEAHTGASLSELPATVSSGDGKVAISSTPGYGEQLLGDWSLADAKNFKDVVSHADAAQGVFYVSFENGWLDAVRKTAADDKDAEATEVADNLDAMRALGASTWSEGSTGHGLIRLVLK